MKSTVVYNIATNEEFLFMNSYSEKHNLVTCFMMFNDSENLHNDAKRALIKGKIQNGGSSWGLGSFCVMKPKRERTPLLRTK